MKASTPNSVQCDRRSTRPSYREASAARLFDPAGGTHRLEEGEGALDHRAILQRVIAAAKPAVCQERLSQLGT
jgi:hypothetical protein